MAVTNTFNGVNLDALNARYVECVWEGNVDGARHYLSRGANIDERGQNGDTALLHAVRAGDLAMALMLIEKKASLDLQDNNDGATALILAAKIGMKAVAAGSALGEAAQHEAMKKCVTLCRALIDAGADINVDDRDGKKALMYAMKTANPVLVELFEKPLMKILQRIPSSDLAQALRASHKNLDDIEPVTGDTMLTWAASQKGQEGVARAFIEAGADLKATNRAGKTPLQVARETGNSPMLQLLEEAQKHKPVVPEKHGPMKPMFTNTAS